jgi:hypothetical protein
MLPVIVVVTHSPTTTVVDSNAKDVHAVLE